MLVRLDNCICLDPEEVTKLIKTGTLHPYGISIPPSRFSKSDFSTKLDAYDYVQL